MTAFSAVMLAMLVTMLIKTEQLHPHHGVGIDLPKVSHPIAMKGANKEDALIIGILRDGQTFLLNESISPVDLPRRIQKLIAEGSDRKIYLRADVRVRYRTVKLILDEVRTAGFQDVGILTDQRKPPGIGQ